MIALTEAALFEHAENLSCPMLLANPNATDRSCKYSGCMLWTQYEMRMVIDGRPIDFLEGSCSMARKTIVSRKEVERMLEGMGDDD